MTFSDSVRTCLREKYATFSGRAPRSEYWWFTLFYFLVMLVIGLAFSLVGGLNDLGNPSGAPELGTLPIIILILGGIFMLGMILPGIAVLVRRFHDRNLSGWWYLAAVVAGFIPFVGFLASIAVLVITVLKGTDGPNKFGPDPLRGGEAEIFA